MKVTDLKLLDNIVKSHKLPLKKSQGCIIVEPDVIIPLVIRLHIWIEIFGVMKYFGYKSVGILFGLLPPAPLYFTIFTCLDQ